jgi:hypothetical protein
MVAKAISSAPKLGDLYHFCTALTVGDLEQGNSIKISHIR